MTMKKYIAITFIGLSLIFLSSCLKSYLDKSPEAGVSSAQVFSKYDNFRAYFDYGLNNIQSVFYGKFVQWQQKYSFESMTDQSDVGRVEFAQVLKSGNAGMNGTRLYDAIFSKMWLAIRIANTTLQNINLLQDATDINKKDLIAQAHFVRAFAHFECLRYWGGMPYLTKVLGPTDNWDMPRLGRRETLLKIAADMDTAAAVFEEAGLMRRDPVPGLPGYLTNPDQDKPNGVAAKAFKARALLYAASPLNNITDQYGNTAGVPDWAAAAKANWEAIQIATQYGYTLVAAADYKTNYAGTTYTNEQLFGYYCGTFNYSTTAIATIVNGIFGGTLTYNAGECPSQQFVDKYETKWGDPLNTQADRDAAAALGHYNEQDPYLNRDPRFYFDIIYNTAPIPGYGTAKIYYDMSSGSQVWSELLDHNYVAITSTGYYLRKRWGEQSAKNQIVPAYSDPVIRLGELYLNYAEAANEAYGPNTPAPGATMTAVDAINYLRNGPNRWTAAQLATVQVRFTTSQDAFRTRIRNERNIELCFEGHYYCDTRRWMEAPAAMSTPIMGMDIEKVSVSPTYPTGYKYTRVPLPANRQTVWKDYMYWLPFSTGGSSSGAGSTPDAYKMKLFIQNPVW